MINTKIKSIIFTATILFFSQITPSNARDTNLITGKIAKIHLGEGRIRVFLQDETYPEQCKSNVEFFLLPGGTEDRLAFLMTILTAYQSNKEISFKTVADCPSGQAGFVDDAILQ